MCVGALLPSMSALHACSTLRSQKRAMYALELELTGVSALWVSACGFWDLSTGPLSLLNGIFFFFLDLFILISTNESVSPCLVQNTNLVLKCKYGIDPPEKTLLSSN